jgi:hypothetical protein
MGTLTMSATPGIRRQAHPHPSTFIAVEATVEEITDRERDTSEGKQER